MGELAANVVHDFNNIFSSILGYCEVMAVDFQPDDPRLMSVRGVGECVDRAVALSHRLLAFSRGQVLKSEIVILDLWASCVMPKLMGLLPSGITLTSEFKAGPARVSLDRAQFEQVLVDLILNARDAIKDRGHIHVRTETDGARVVLSVEDDGEGMSPDVLARIFEPFFTTKHRGKNPGLGLAAVYGIVGQSGGTVEATSVPGRGSRFSVYLPRES